MTCLDIVGGRRYDEDHRRHGTYDVEIAGPHGAGKERQLTAWPRLSGWMSRKAKTLSLSKSLKDGMSPVDERGVSRAIEWRDGRTNGRDGGLEEHGKRRTLDNLAEDACGGRHFDSFVLFLKRAREDGDEERWNKYSRYRGIERMSKQLNCVMESSTCGVGKLKKKKEEAGVGVERGRSKIVKGVIFY